jgi:integrase
VRFGESSGSAEISENQGSGLDFQDFLHRAEQLSGSISKHQLEEVRSVLTRAHAARFRKRKEPRYGSINKGFTELELQRFLRNVKNDKFGLLFKYQAQLGLRVGEVSKLHISNIDFDKRELTIKSEKSGKMDSLIIPFDLFKETIAFINQNKEPIWKAQGYLFFKDNNNNHNGVPYVDLNYIRKVFRETVIQANLGQIYAYSEETTVGHRERPLYRLTTHSLRHYAITHFAKSTNGNMVLSSRFARHASPSTTMRYIAKDNEQLYKEIDLAFSIKELNQLQALSNCSCTNRSSA